MTTSRTNGGFPEATRSLPGLCLRLAKGWWRSVLPLAAAAAILAAVIGGAVGVGDSIVTNLVRRTEGRLGGILAALTAATPFDASLAGRTAASLPRDPANGGGGADAAGERLVPAFILPVTVESTGSPRRVVPATLLGIDDPASLGFAGRAAGGAVGGVAINGPLARELGASSGEAVVLRTLERSAIPADNPLGRRVTGGVGRRVSIAAILDGGGLGGFSLRPSQSDDPLVVVPLATAQELARRPGAANTILAVTDGSVAATDSRADVSRRSAARLSGAIRPTLLDLGLELEPVRGDLVRLSSESLVLPPEADRAAEAVLGPIGGSPALLFLANDLSAEPDAEAGKAGGSVPYSTIAGIEKTELPFGRLVSSEGELIEPPGPGQIIVDAWVAEDLAKQGRPIGIGSRLAVRFFAPETLHGRPIEQSRTFVVSGIARMEGAAVERSLAPEVEGITDKRSIANWDPPFPFDASRVRTTPPNDQDDRYWKDHGATPKAFVSMADAREVAGGRFGRTTTWHVRLPEGTAIEELASRLASAIDPTKLAFLVRPVLADGLAAARGSTPFAGLFMALSSFVVVAGLALLWLLARLLVTARLSAVGTLAAVGWKPARLAWLFGGVGAMAAAAGCLVGAMAGPAWSGVLLGLLARGLTQVDGGASGTVFQPTLPRFGTFLGVATASFLMAAIAPLLAARRAARLDPKSLLAGREPAASSSRRPRRLAWVLAAASLAAAITVAASGGSAEEESGRFFLAGALAVFGGCCLVRTFLGAGPVRGAFGLVRRAVSMRPDRTLSVVGMVAVAEFLIVAVSAFGVRPPAEPRERRGPTGGWTLMATLAEPCAADLTDPSQLESLGLSVEQTRALLSATVAPVRMGGGEDASCLNLQKVAVPTVLGVDRRFRERGGFRFVASREPVAGGPAGRSPWSLLDRPASGRVGPMPAVIDEATARYALGLSGLGARLVIPDERGTAVEVEIVGLLAPGILQGSLVVSEEDFLALFPSTSGSRLMLAEVPGSPEAGVVVEEALRTALADFGPTVRTTTARMASLAAVQNTYLAGFQALGTLGLLLGTVGVAVVQARSLLERAGEIGLLAAIGFTPSRTGRLVAAETLAMVAAGLAVGLAAAVIAVWPQMAAGRAFLPVGWAAASCLGTLVVAASVGWLVVGRLAAVHPAEAIRAPE